MKLHEYIPMIKWSSRGQSRYFITLDIKEVRWGHSQGSAHFMGNYGYLYFNEQMLWLNDARQLTLYNDEVPRIKGITWMRQHPYWVSKETLSP